MYVSLMVRAKGQISLFTDNPIFVTVVLQPARSATIMAKDYQQLWHRINMIDEARAIRNLTEILVDGNKLDEAGRDFISNLDPKDVELCIEILDRVCRSLLRPLTT